MSHVEALGYSLLGISIILRLTCGRRVKRGSKYAADAEFHAPLATRWFSPQVVEVGAWVGLFCLLAAVGLLFTAVVS